MINKLVSSMNVGFTKFVGEFINKGLSAGKETLEAREARVQKALEDAKIGLAQSGLSILGQLAEEGSALGKAVAVSQAVISTYQGINKALAETTDVTPTQSLRFANAAAVGVAGFLNVSKILATNTSTTSSASAPSQSNGASAPSFNLVQGTGTNQIAETLQEQREPLQAYVVSSDVTSAQSLDRNIVDNATL